MSSFIFITLVSLITFSNSFISITTEPTILLDETDGVGIVHAESRFLVTPTGQSDPSVAHNFVVTITQNTLPFVSGTNFPGNGKVSVSIVPPLAVAETLDFTWHLDGRMEVDP